MANVLGEIKYPIWKLLLKLKSFSLPPIIDKLPKDLPFTGPIKIISSPLFSDELTVSLFKYSILRRLANSDVLYVNCPSISFITYISLISPPVKVIVNESPSFLPNNLYFSEFIWV